MRKFVGIFALICLFAIPAVAHAADCYFVGDTDGDWNDSTNWASSSGGCGDTCADTIPTTTTNVKVDSNSPSNALDTNFDVLSVDFTGFTNTFNFSSYTLTSSGDVTFVSGMTLTAGTGRLKVDASATVTSGGKSVYQLEFAGAIDITISGDLGVTNKFYPQTANNQTITIDGDDIQLSGDMEIANLATFDGSATIDVNGTGAQTLDFGTMESSNVRYMSNPIVISNTSDTVTMDHNGGGYVIPLAGGIDIDPSATVDFTTNTTKVRILQNSATYDFGGQDLYQLDLQTGSDTITLDRNVTVKNTLYFNATTLTMNGYKIIAKGDVTGGVNKGSNIGTTVLELSGTGSQTVDLSGCTASSRVWSLAIVINKGGGGVTWAGANGDLKFETSGDITNTAGGSLVDFATNSVATNLQASATWDTDGIDFHALSFGLSSTNITVTMLSDITATNTLTLNQGNQKTTFNGAYVVRALGDVAATNSGAGTDGTASLSIEGSTNQSVNLHTASAAYVHAINIDIASTGGAVSFVADSGSYINRIGGSLTKTSGTVDTTTNSPSFYIRTTTGSHNLMGMTIGGGLNFAHYGSTYVLDGNVTVVGTFNYGSGSGAPQSEVINGNTLYLQGNIAGNSGSSGTSGTTVFEVSGSAAQSIQFDGYTNNSAYAIANPVVLNKSGSAGTWAAGYHLLKGNVTYSGGTFDFTTNSSAIKFSGTSAQNLSLNGLTLYDVLVDGTDVNATANMSISHDLTINSGKTFKPGSAQITISNNFTNGGTLTPGTSTFIFDKSGTAVVDGTTTFYNLTNNATQLNFDDADVFTISGTGAGNGIWSSDDATNTVDIDFAAETISSADGTRVDSAGGVAVTTTGTITDCVNWTAPAGAPDQVTGLSATAQADALTIDLSWTEPGNGGDPITGYLIERESPVGGGWSTLVADTGTTDTTYADTGLSAGTQYNYRVSAINGTGTGPASTAANDTTSDVPDQVTGLTATKQTCAKAIDLSWSAPAGNGSAITGYKIERESPAGGGFSTLVADTGTTSTTYSDTGLSAATEYNYKVSAINAIGTGSASTADSDTTNDVPGAPTGLGASAASHTQIDLSWTAPVSDGGCSITGYYIERESPTGGGFSDLVADTGNTDTTYSDTGLTPETEYNYRVSAINGIGTSSASTAAADTTDAAPAAAHKWKGLSFIGEYAKATG